MTLSSLLSIGSSSLMNAQTGISVTGENIANADTEGYSRQTVNYSTSSYISIYGQSIGTGASVESITRSYDYFIEAQYLSYYTQSTYYETMSETLSSVETLFTEDDDYGISTALDDFIATLSALSEAADDEATRQEVIDYAETFIDTLETLAEGLETQIDSLNASIEDDVDTANQLMEDLAALNASLTGDSDNSELLDERDSKIRELSALLDIEVDYGDNSTVTIRTTSGQTLVDGTVAYSIGLESAQATADLTQNSTFDGSIYFEGESSQEITIKFVTEGAADGTSNAATFQVSLDGGETWLTDDNGEVLTYTAGGYEDAVEIEGVSIWFGTSDDAYAEATTDISVGDEFEVIAKTGLYWYSTTSGKENITPLEDSDSGDDDRLSGGTIASQLTTRDYQVTAYLEELDAIVEELVWEVNYQHSQGTGLTHYSYTSSTNSVDNASAALGDSSLAYADYLTEGSFSLAFYDSTVTDSSGASTTSLGVYEIDFSSIVPPGTATFDPSVHSLEDVATAINESCDGLITATVVDGQLILDAADGVEFEFSDDTTGILAAMGINTFFEGSSVDDIAVDSRVSSDTNRINAGQVDSTGISTSGDNTNANALIDALNSDVTLNTVHSTASQTITEHLHSLVATVGLDTDSAARNYTYTTTLAESLEEEQESVSGVSLDEELTNLTKYQQAYEAAAQLITTAQELFDIVLSLKD